MVSVIIIQYNNSQLTETAIETLLKFHKDNLEVILIDNGSTDPNALSFTEQYPGLKIIRCENNLGFGAANNLASKQASGDILLFLNNDVVITSDFISNIEIEFNRNSSIGIIGPKLLNKDNSLQLSCGELPSFVIELRDKILYAAVDKKNTLALKYINGKFIHKEEMEWVTGAALFITKKLFEELKGFDESYFMYYEDKDLCARALEKGKKVLYFLDSNLIHLKGGSFNGPNKKFLMQKYRESQVLYYQKHKSKFQQTLLHAYLKLSGKLN